MLKNFKKIDTKHTGLFAAGVLFGTAGIKILASEDARKLYANCTAAVLRAKECVMKTATNIQEHAEDILWRKHSRLTKTEPQRKLLLMTNQIS